MLFSSNFSSIDILCDLQEICHNFVELKNYFTRYTVYFVAHETSICSIRLFKNAINKVKMIEIVNEKPKQMSHII